MTATIESIKRQEKFYVEARRRAFAVLGLAFVFSLVVNNLPTLHPMLDGGLNSLQFIAAVIAGYQYCHYRAHERSLLLERHNYLIERLP